MRRFILFIALAPAPALAHPGHIADLAGHAHWVALGATLAAAALAAALAKAKRSEDAGNKARDEPEGDAEPEAS